MMVLADVETILIRLEYIDSTEREVELTHITIDSSGVDDRGLGSASLVEECQCPPGYMGYSCERCAPGYIRQKNGPWLGRCVPYVVQSCSSGEYGDPSRGIPCRPCPCPLTNSGNNFATGCRMGPDGEPICNCDIGYTGHRCQTCAPGYEGNPMQPGSYCRPKPSTDCHPDGTQATRPNGTCECKTSVVGPRCDICALNSFHLNSYSYGGCIECFCMGVSQTCSSSNYYRDTIRSSFSSSRGAHGFTLVNDYENENTETFDIRETDTELVYNGGADTSDVLYWSLPPKFLGDKVTAYGGVLNYTVRFNPLPGGQRSRNVAPDVVIKSVNDIVVLHYNHNEVTPSLAHTYTIPIVENSWQRNDGVTVNREHLLMALADIEAIYIKATYTTTTQEAALIHVSMDTAVRPNTGRSRAYEVEQCVCPPGYTGLSCEDCAPGYKRSQETGLYLGICEVCECNGHSNECDPESGVCLNCRDNTYGQMCDQCLPGFEGNATLGSYNDCRPTGAGPQSICQRCDQRGVATCDNNYCECKQNVIGETCDRCRPGTFNLDRSNPLGCDECFCSGVTTQCTQSNFYKGYIPYDFWSNKPIIASEDGYPIDDGNLHHDADNNLYRYRTPSYTQKYWSLGGSVLGDQVKSYGGNLEFKLNGRFDNNAQFTPGKDVILRGNGETIYWSRPPGGDTITNFSVAIVADGSWYRESRYHGPHPASKNDIMTVLSNVDNILIRATPSIPTLESSLSDIVLETADTFGVQPAPIEYCTCPEGYEGTSCENCAQFHYRNTSQTDRGSFGSCLGCHNWCSDQIDACEMNSNGNVICHCKPGYEGDRCQYSDRPVPVPTTERPEATISVHIEGHPLKIIPLGQSLTLTCRAIILANRASPVNIHWTKLDDELPSSAEQRDGVLTMYNLQVHDSGVYVCQAVSGNEYAEQQIPINVGPVEPERPSPPVIHFRPSHIIDTQEYETVEAICETSGNPAPTVQWSRIDGPLSPNVRIDGDRLYISPVQRSDEGAYRCVASNSYGVSDETLQIYVRPRERPTRPPPPPTPQDVVVIEPPSYTGRVGERVRLICELRQRFIVDYEWFKDDQNLQWNQNVDINDNELIIRNAVPQDSGNYVCKVVDVSNGNTYSSSSYVHIEDDDDSGHGGGGDDGYKDDEIYVKPLKERHIIIQGQNKDITCEAIGRGRPTVKWTRLHGQLDSSIQIRDNVLSIKNAQPHHRGLYVCIAESAGGITSESHTIIDVEPRERPLIEIYPTEPQEYRIGDRAIVDCRAVAGIPEPIILWHRTDGRPLPTNIQEDYKGRLTINNLQEGDGGTYECTAENIAGRITGTTVINIVQPPQLRLDPNVTELVLTEGEELRIICIGTGIPTPQVEWDTQTRHVSYGLSGLPSPAPRAELYIPRVSLNDAKLYTCKGTSSAGVEMRYVNVEIRPRRGDTGASEIDEPTTHRYPARPTSPGYYIPKVHPVGIGERIALSCTNADEHALDTSSLDIYWTRVDGKPLPPNSISDGNDLIIYNVNYDSVGMYRCNIIGPNGNPIQYFDASIILADLPHITLSPEMPITVKLGETVNVYCNATGAQPIQVEWHAESRRPMSPSIIADGPYLTFNSIKYSDAGRYYCTAANHLGNATKVAEVIVNRGETVHERPPTHLTRHEIFEGLDVNLKCDVPPRPEGGVRYVWTRANGQIPQSSYENSNNLLLRQVSVYDEGRYTCKVLSSSNQLITETSVDLIVKPTRPDNVATLPILKLDQQEASLRIGESTEVECLSTDKRYPDVIWERADGRPLPRNVRQLGNKLIADNVDLISAGTYVCRCKTDEGDLYTTSFELKIEEEEIRPRNRPRIVHAKVGSNANLKCLIEHYPSTIRWARQHGQMQHGKDLHAPELRLNNVQASDAGTYTCTITHHGESFDQPIILAVTGSIPQFNQTSTSYMSFPTLETAYMKFDIEVTFKPTKSDGLILYNGQRRGGGDFISLSLNDNYPEFRFDFGTQPHVVRAEKPVTLNEWHTVKVSRLRRDGYLIVDEHKPVAFPPAQTTGLDLVEDLYIGGVPKWDDIAPDAVKTKTGFDGCISQLVLQGRPVELLKEAKHKENVQQCQPCADKPCHNGGICLESQTATGYLCVCDEGFTGKTCAIEGDQCTPGICGAGRCHDTDFGIECLCPLNKTGDRCQYYENLDGNILSFKEASYAAYKTPRPSKLNIKLSIKPTSLEDSVILYVAESERANGDFFAVLLKNKHIELRINTGARVKPVIVTSQNEVEVNKWFDIEVGRRVGEGILKVGKVEQTGKQSGPARSLYLKTHLFVGGYDKRILLNRDIDVHRGFDGCITKLEESGRKINLIADLLDAANVQNCVDSNNVWPPTPAQHIPSGDSSDKHPDHVSESDSNEIDIDVRHKDGCGSGPCENYGACEIIGQHDYKCHCPLGFAGKNCHEHVQLDTNCQFNGDGYLELNRSVFTETEQQLESFIAILFSTKAPNGLLIWWGQPKGEKFNGQDFMALGINEGILEFSFRIDGEETTVKSSHVTVSDGGRHIAIIKRHGTEVSLELDTVIDYGETKRPTGRKSIILPGNLFIGGAPYLAEFTGNRYLHAFDGCVRVVETDESGPLHLGQHAVSALNSDVCPSDDFDDPEPPLA